MKQSPVVETTSACSLANMSSTTIRSGTTRGYRTGEIEPYLEAASDVREPESMVAML